MSSHQIIPRVVCCLYEKSVSEKRRQNQTPAPLGTARMAARGNPSGDSIAEPSTDLRAMIEERDVGSMEEDDPATLENGMNIHLPTTRSIATSSPPRNNRRPPASQFPETG